MSISIVVLAAGMGSRFGGPKQLVPIGPSGESILDYNVFDAVEAGFDRVVVVTRPELQPQVEEVVERATQGRAETAITLQRIPEGRSKPYGTADAVLSAAPHIDGPFGVANADDLYGSGSFSAVVDALRADDTSAGIVGFALDETVPIEGKVSRGLLKHDGQLIERVVETHGIHRVEGGWAPAEADGFGPLTGETLASMNLLGLPHRVFVELQEAVDQFVADGAEGEVYLPEVVGAMLERGELQVKLLRTDERWAGMTNPEDLEVVKAYARKRKTSPLG